MLPAIGKKILITIPVIILLTFISYYLFVPVPPIDCHEKTQHLHLIIKNANYCERDIDCIEIDSLDTCGSPPLIHKSQKKFIDAEIEYNKSKCSVTAECQMLDKDYFKKDIKCINSRCERL